MYLKYIIHKYMQHNHSSARDIMGSYEVNVTEFLLTLSECLRTVSNKTALTQI